MFTAMGELTPPQKELVRNLRMVANCNESTAITCLTQADWDFELALDIYDEIPSYQESFNSTACSKIDALFNEYANDPADKGLVNSEEPRIGPNGMHRLLNDLGIDPSSINALVLAWKMHAEIQCEFSLNEFRTGLREMGVDSMDKFRSQVLQWSEELEDQFEFRSLYQFTFGYAKKASTRFLDIDTAIACWTLLFRDKDPRLNLWIEFLKSQEQRGVSLDTWNLFLEFLLTTSKDYSNYNSAGAWPIIIDSFVDYARDHQ